MNRTLLLIICDFLLLNLLALTRWDAPEPVAPAAVAMTAASPRSQNDDLVASLREVLAEERGQREELLAHVAAREASVSELERQRRELDAQRRQLATNLVQTRHTATQLDNQLASVSRQASETQKQLVQTQARLTETEATRNQLQNSVRLTEADRQRLTDRLAREQAETQRQLADLERQRQMAETLAQAKAQAEQRVSSLTTEVKVAEAEKKLLQQNVTDLRDQVTQSRVEKDRLQTQTGLLAQGFQQLAKNSDALKSEIRENTPVNANQLFADFLTNRVQVYLSGVGAGLFGSALKAKEATTLLISEGTNVFALLHLNEAPFSLSIPGFGLDALTTRVAHGGRSLSPGTPYLLEADPRILAVPVPAAQTEALGLKVYPLSKNPFKFSEAMLVNRGGRYYGEVEFKLDPRTPHFVRMKTRLTGRLFGEFSPSAGDLVLSKSGELLGVMVNGEYCVVPASVRPAPGGELAAGLTRDAMGRKLEIFRGAVDRLPAPLR